MIQIRGRPATWVDRFVPHELDWSFNRLRLQLCTKY